MNLLLRRSRETHGGSFLLYCVAFLLRRGCHDAVFSAPLWMCAFPTPLPPSLSTLTPPSLLCAALLHQPALKVPRAAGARVQAAGSPKITWSRAPTRRALPPRWSPNSARWSACARSRRLRRTSRSSCTPAPRKPEPPRRAGRAASHPLTRPLQREHAAAQARADGRWARRDDPAEDGGHGAVQLGQGPDWLLDDHRG